MRTAVFPGTFDPLTNGHLDVIDRAARLFDRVIVALLVNPGKQPMFRLDERRAMARAACEGRPAIEVDTFEGLLVEYARSRGASAVVRGVRNATDFDYERQMALMNHHLAPDLDTVLLTTSAATAHISATLVREIATLGGDVRGLVPPAVLPYFARRQPSRTVRV